MTNDINTDICVLGAGSAGLVVAASAAFFGVKVVLVEKDLMGGDCLNYGCVPSKALIYTGKLKAYMRALGKIGIDLEIPETNFTFVKNYIDRVVKTIEPNDSIERFEGMGVKVLKGEAKFVNKKQVIINDKLVTSKKFVICSGSRPQIPKIQGLNDIPYHTNETIFKNTDNPSHLVIIGAGAVGVEIAQAYSNLSVDVSLLDNNVFLNGKDQELSKILKSRMKSQGVDIYDEVNIREIIKLSKEKYRIVFEKKGEEILKDFSHLLLSTGRVANLDDLALDNAGIKYTKSGIVVNSRMRTSNKRVFAAGDVIGKNMFTHSASYEAGIVIRNILFKVPAKAKMNVPEVIYSSPEYASIGISEDDAIQNYSSVNILRWPISENDRAITEGHEIGVIKVFVKKNGIILGVKILAPNAADLIVPWMLAMNKKVTIASMANLIIPYPTLSEISKRVSNNFFLPKLTSKLIKKLVKVLVKI